jgi:hypothetical protein
MVEFHYKTPKDLIGDHIKIAAAFANYRWLMLTAPIHGVH